MWKWSPFSSTINKSPETLGAQQALVFGKVNHSCKWLQGHREVVASYSQQLLLLGKFCWVRWDWWWRRSLLWGMWRSGSWQGWQSVTSQIGSPGPWKQLLPWTVLSQVHLEFVSLVSMTQEKNTEEHWLKGNITVDKDKWKDDHTVSNNT